MCGAGSFLPLPPLDVFGELAPEDAPPGAVTCADGGIELNAGALLTVPVLSYADWKLTPCTVCGTGRKTVELSIVNSGDRPIQVWTLVWT